MVVGDDIIEDSPLPIDDPPDLNRIYVHPLFFVAAFLLHTALTVLFTLYVAPFLAAGASVSVAALAVTWIVIALITFGLAIYRQRNIEGSIYVK